MPKILKLIIVCEEFKPDGDDLMVLLATNYAVRGVLAPFGQLSDRADMTPADIRAWIAGAVAAGEDVLVVATLSASPPTAEEARKLDADYLRATSPTGAADVREGRAALPERFSDDWIHEIGPKCSAAIQAAQMGGAELVVLVPPVRLHTLTRAMQEAVELVQDPTLRQEFIERMAITFRGADEAADVHVPVQALGDGPDAVAMRLFRRLRATMPTPPDEAPPSASEATAAPSAPGEPSSDASPTPAL